MRQRIEEKVAGKTRLFIFTNQDLKAYIIKITDQWFGLTYIQLAVAVLVAILGIINTLTVSITDRRRELGVLQAVGALPAFPPSVTDAVLETHFTFTVGEEVG